MFRRRKSNETVEFASDLEDMEWEDLRSELITRIKAVPNGKKLALALEDAVGLVRKYNLIQSASDGSNNTGQKMAASRMAEIQEQERKRKAKQDSDMAAERKLLSDARKDREKESAMLKQALEGDTSAKKELAAGKPKKLDPMADIEAAWARDQERQQANAEANRKKAAADKAAADAARTEEEKRAAEQAEWAADAEKKQAAREAARKEGYQLQVSSFNFSGLRDPDLDETTDTVAYMRLLLMYPRTVGDGRNVRFDKMDDYDATTTVLAHTFASDVLTVKGENWSLNELYTMFLPATVPGTVLRVELWGEDNQKTDDFLGQYEMIIDDLVADQAAILTGGKLVQGNTSVKQQPVTGNVKYAVGLSSVKLPYFDTYRGSDAVYQLPDPKAEPWPGAEKDNLLAIEYTIASLIGQGVMTGDRYGKADVYATIALWDDQQKMGEWRSVKMRQAHYTHFEFTNCPTVLLPSYGRGNMKLQIQFWDADTLSYDDFLGQSYIYLDVAVNPAEEQPQGFVKSAVLEPRTKKFKHQSNKIRGQMQVTLYTKLLPTLPSLKGSNYLRYVPL